MPPSPHQYSPGHYEFVELAYGLHYTLHMHGDDLELLMLKSTFDGFLPESACDDLQLMLSLLRRYVHTFEVYGERGWMLQASLFAPV